MSAAEPVQTGFMFVSRAGAAALEIHGASGSGRVPLLSVHSDGDCHAALMGRLYYRADLLGRLGGASPAGDSDAALALASYRKFGRDGVAALEGDFAVAVIDRGRKRLIASRDPMGGYPLYWLQHGDTFAAATGLRPLVELLPERSVDSEFLAELQMLPYAEMDYYPRTPFAGINRLVPDSLLDVDLASLKIETVKFWDWQQRAVDPGTDDLGEIGAHYRAALTDAVRERLRGTVAAHVSGGMDSTTVGFLAADALSAGGRSLHALSLEFKSLPGLEREQAYLDAALDRPGIVAHRIPAHDLLDYDVFRDAPLHDEPYSGLFRVGLDVAMNRVAAEAGVDTVLTGLGSDELLAAVPFHLADLVKRGRLVAAWSEAARWSKANTTSIWKMLRPFGLVPLLPAWLQPGLGPLLRGGFATWTRQNQQTIAPWVKPDFARKAHMQRRGIEQVRRNYRSARRILRSEALARLRLTSGDWVRAALSAPLGIHQSHPFRDPRMMALGLGIRDRFRPAPGQQKAVLAAAMRDVLPAKILQRPGKGHFNSLIFAGLTRNLPYLESMVRESKVGEMGLFDTEGLIECLRDAAIGARNVNGLLGLNNSLAIIKWLSLLPRWLAQRPKPERVITI